MVFTVVPPNASHIVSTGQMFLEQLNALVSGQCCQFPAPSGEQGQNVGLDCVPVPPAFRPHWWFHYVSH